ncbi:hypothetical protein PINS_up003235 [Pythium insidiosum]|nr:hypothetical protein PINS_up003235 [Pythium insidiosum]
MLHILGPRSFTASGEMRHFLANIMDTQEQRRRDGTNGVLRYGTQIRTPNFSFQRIRELMFGTTLLFRNKVVLVMF